MVTKRSRKPRRRRAAKAVTADDATCEAILDLLSVSVTPLTRSKLVGGLRRLGVWAAGGKRYTTTTVLPLLAAMQRKGQVRFDGSVVAAAGAALETLGRLHGDPDRLRQLLEIVESADPARPQRRYYHGAATWASREHYRRWLQGALLLGDAAQAQSLLADADFGYRVAVGEDRDPLLTQLPALAPGSGLAEALLAKLPAGLRARIRAEQLLAAMRTGRRVDALPVELDASGLDAYGRAAVATHAIWCGNPGRVQQLCAGHDDSNARIACGWAKIAEGDVAAGGELLEQARTALRRETKKRTGLLPFFPGVLYTAGLLQRGEVARAVTYLRSAARGCRTSDEEAVFTGLAALAESFATAEPIQSYRLAALRPTDSPLMTLAAGLLRRWAGAKLTATEQRLVTSTAENADAAGYPWLAAELRGIVAPRTRSAAAPGLRDLVRLPERWERQLSAVERALRADAEPDVAASSDAVADRRERLVWLLAVGEGYVDIIPKLQTRQRRGWSKGRPVALARLYDDPGSVDCLTEADRRVIAHIECDAVDTGWGRRGRIEYCYDFDEARALDALAQHDEVFWQDAPDRRVRMEVRRASLVLEERGKGRLRLVVDPPHAQHHAVKREGDLLLRYRLDPKQEELAELIDKGIDAPAEARGRLEALLQALSGVFPVQSAVGAEPDAPLRAADSTLWARLDPAGPGLQVRFRVRPLGPGGPALAAGAGAPLVMGEVDGERRSVKRDLVAEAAAVQGTRDRCPALADARPAGTGWIVDDAESALDLVAQLQAAADVAIDWPEGEGWRVLSPGDLGALRLRAEEGARGGGIGVRGELALADGDKPLELERVLALLQNSPAGRYLALGDQRFVALSAALREALDTLARLARPQRGKLRLESLHAPLLGDLEAAGAQAAFGQRLQARLRRRTEAFEREPRVPATVAAELRPYQVQGFRWMSRLASLGLGMCLGDEMGLGKTVQTLAVLTERAAEGPALVVAPTSVIGVWQEELARFAPGLRGVAFGAGDRAGTIRDAGPGDVVICSYALLQRSGKTLAQGRWHSVVFDEAQALKNPRTKRRQAAAKLQAGCRIALTGTPLENHLGELWSLFDLLDPGLLGSERWFRATFQGPIEEARDAVARHQLRRLVRPYLLRRRRVEVLPELPPRTEVTLHVALGKAEAALYEAQRQRALEATAGPIAGPGVLGRLLAEITRLRRAACHPRLVLPDAPQPSAKLAALAELVDGLRRGGHRALVFSQFVDHLTIVRDWAQQEGIPLQYLDGSTPARERQRRVRAFQGGEGDLFLISLRAGGTGLSLTAADYVIHLDPWWNPAVEDQASDRAYRIGQHRPVTIYRLIAAGTIEEQVLGLHARKRELADDLLAGAEASGRLTAAELMALLRPAAPDAVGR